MKQFLQETFIECLWHIKNTPVKVIEKNIKREVGRKARQLMGGY